MPSKYKKKISKPITKQSNRYIPAKHEQCTNCGRVAPLSKGNMQFSKCQCGGTFQSFGVDYQGVL